MNDPRFGRMAATDEAAHWHLRQREGALSATEQQRFMEWLVASPEHLREYLAMARVTAELGDAVRGMPVDPETEAFIAGRPANRANVVPLDRTRTDTPVPVRAKRRRWLPRMAVAATLLLAVAAGWQAVAPSPRHYLAPHGTPRVFALDDGTVLHLNAESEASVALGLFHRRVALISGQASFVVAPGRRPFTVRAAGMEVRDIGTTFDVSLQHDQARFGVTEGRIHVVDQDGAGRLLADLQAGQAARIAHGDRHVQISEEDADVLTAWWDRRVVFRDEPLRDIADRFNRMNRVRVHIDDRVAGALRLTGNLQANDLASLRAFLDEQPTLATTASTQEIRVRSRQAPLPTAY